MLPKNRLFLVLAALLVLPLWALPAQAADLKGALAYVPNDAVGAMTIDVDGIKTTPMFQRAVTMFFNAEPAAKKKLAELKQNTGFDPLTHVHGLVLAAGPSFPKVDDDFVLVAEAKLDEARMVAFMKKEGAKITTKNDALGRYYLFGSKSDGAMAFRGKFVIIGGLDSFRRALAKKGPSAKLSAALAPHLSKHVGFAAEVSPAMRAELERDRQELGQMQLVSGSLQLTSGLTLNTVATFATAAPAAKLAKEANDGLAQVKRDKDMKKMGLDQLIGRLQVKAVRNQLRLDVKLTQADLDKLEKLAGGFF